jgi:hypothetical protein
MPHTSTVLSCKPVGQLVVMGCKSPKMGSPIPEQGLLIKQPRKLKYRKVSALNQQVGKILLVVDVA